MRVIKPADKSQPPLEPIITTELLSIRRCGSQTTRRPQHNQSSRLISAVSITCLRRISTRSIIYSNLAPMSEARLGSEVKEPLVVTTLTLPISNSYWASNRTSNHITQLLVRCNNKPWFRRSIATQKDELSGKATTSSFSLASFNKQLIPKKT